MLIGLTVATQEVSRATSECHVEHLKFVQLKEVKLAEIWEESAKGADFWSETKLTE